MKNKLYLVLAITFAFAGLAAAVNTVSGNLSVSGTIPGTGCQLISVDPVDFGTLDGSPRFVNGTITVNCPSGLPYMIALDAGLHYAPTSRNMYGPDGDLISYFLFQDIDRTLEWGDTCGGNSYAQGSCLAGTGAGSNVSLPVFADIDLSSQAGDTPGLYLDSVVVTVAF